MMIRAVSFFAAFVLAVWSLQAGWSQFRSTLDAPTPGGWAATLGYLILFAAAFLSMGFWLYAQDRAAGRVRRRIGLYERLLAKIGR